MPLFGHEVATGEGMDVLLALAEDTGTATGLDHPLDEHQVQALTVGDDATRRGASHGPTLLVQVPVHLHAVEFVGVVLVKVVTHLVHLAPPVRPVGVTMRSARVHR